MAIAAATGIHPSRLFVPLAPQSVQYVKICSLYGAGFYYMPGTDTCLKVGGWVRAEINVNSGGSFNPFKNVNFDTRNYDKQTTRSRGIITLDARSQTEYGTLRAYIAGGFQYTSSRAGGTGDFNQVYAPRAFIQGFISHALLFGLPIAWTWHRRTAA